MASECAVLGVPAVYVSPLGRGYTDDEERTYGLVHNFTGPRFHEDFVATAERLVADPELGEKARAARARLLADKVDVTTWMLDFFEREYQAHFSS
jgi:predicted glycosyltransferase